MSTHKLVLILPMALGLVAAEARISSADDSARLAELPTDSVITAAPNANLSEAGASDTDGSRPAPSAARVASLPHGVLSSDRLPRAQVPSSLAPLRAAPAFPSKPDIRPQAPSPSRAPQQPSAPDGPEVVSLPAHPADLWPDQDFAPSSAQTPGRRSPMADPLRRALRDALARAPRDLRAYYEAKTFEPVWISAHTDGAGALWPKIEAVLQQIETAHHEGLPAKRFDTQDLRKRVETHLRKRVENQRDADALDRQAAVQIETRLSALFVRYARAAHAGILTPKDVVSDVFSVPPVQDVETLLEPVKAGADPSEILREAIPHGADYQSLRAELQRLRLVLSQAEQMSQSADTTGIVARRGVLRPGAIDPDVTTIRQWLTIAGDLEEGGDPIPEVDGGTAFYDARMVEAVRSFQARNGLSPDGIIGPQTRAAINRGPQEKIERILVNMERLRWTNRPRGERHVRVNIPDFHVEIIDQGKVSFRSRVVVGKAKDHQTPEFSDVMTHVVVNPLWHVPREIATEEFLPLLINNPGVLAERNMYLVGAGGVEVDPWGVDWASMTPETFPFRLRQRSGPGNALGNVKFIFPNDWAIYLHDTPSKSLFRHQYRAYSHGCVRVARPEALAHALFAPQSDAPEALYSHLRKAGEQRWVNLDPPVPVHLDYRTAWIDENGALQTRPDVYGRDRKILQALRRAGVFDAPETRATAH
ncbi:MAG: L,D-transpeptidase family protein [Neomegalonema sp.]|nr:L,D-transpeptidase family protein [Neomegalonema sp.]